MQAAEPRALDPATSGKRRGDALQHRRVTLVVRVMPVRSDCAADVLDVGCGDGDLALAFFDPVAGW